MQYESIPHALSHQFVLCSPLPSTKFGTCSFSNISKHEKYLRLFYEVTQIKNLAADRVNLNDRLKCTRVCISVIHSVMCFVTGT